ncbi:MAG: hypothetical protein ABRQ23_00155 [Syntrophomonadaceae bacterium]
MPDVRVPLKNTYRLLFALHLFVGTGAIVGGLAAIINHQTPLGMPIENLKYSPFTNYLIPGIILFTIIGLGSLFSAYMILVRSRFQGYISSVSSWALVIFIVVQVIMLHSIHYLHVIFFLIGLVEVGLSTNILFEQKLFPANIILKHYKNK